MKSKISFIESGSGPSFVSIQLHELSKEDIGKLLLFLSCKPTDLYAWFQPTIDGGYFDFGGKLGKTDAIELKKSKKGKR